MISVYEWKKTGTGKQPYAIGLTNSGLMALAGLWENWRSPTGEWIRSFGIVTTQPNELCAELHNRMPVILKPEAWPVWLGERRPVRSEGVARAVSVSGNDLLACEHAGGKRKE